jgi:hypothetical protein
MVVFVAAVEKLFDEVASIETLLLVEEIAEVLLEIIVSVFVFVLVAWDVDKGVGVGVEVGGANMPGGYGHQ